MSGRAATDEVIPGDYAMSVGLSDLPAPDGWEWHCLSDIARLESGHTPSRKHPEYWDGDIPWIGIRDANVHHAQVISETFQHVTELGLANSAARLLPTNTVCMSRTASVGYVVILGRPMATSQDFVCWVCSEVLDPKFLMHLLLAESGSLHRFGRGSTHTTIYFPEVKAFHVCLPPLAEQGRIVGKLEEVLGKVAACQGRLARVPGLLKRFRQSVLAAACSGKLTADWREENPVEDAQELVVRLAALRESLWNSRTGGSVRRSYKPPFISELAQLDLPSTWQEVTVSQLALLDVGHAFKSAEFETDGIRLLRGENLEPGRLRWTDTRYWPADKLSGLEHLLVEEGEIILALDRPVISTGLKIARTTKADLPCALVQRMMRFKLVDELITPWLFYNLNLPAFIEHLSAGLTGSDIPHVTGTGVAEYVVALPPLAEQHEIVRRVEQLFALADRLEAQLDAARKRVDRLTQSILAKAFRGELVPTEADLARREGRTYEPASELLARIRQQLTAPPKARKPRRPKSVG